DRTTRAPASVCGAASVVPMLLQDYFRCLRAYPPSLGITLSKSLAAQRGNPVQHRVSNRLPKKGAVYQPFESAMRFLLIWLTACLKSSL
ncbi:MAG: hypothetical protein WB697_17475, partial [Stellaceae bacterium]